MSIQNPQTATPDLDISDSLVPKATAATPVAAPSGDLDLSDSLVPKAAPQDDTGIWAGVKRNTVGAVQGLYHAMTDPATDQEKTALLQKIRQQNANGDKIDESLATDPSKATLAYHRLIDAPADVLAKKSDDEEAAAKDLLAKHKLWQGGNLYLSGLTDKGLSALPLVGPAINAISERWEKGDRSGAATDVASLVAMEHAPAILKTSAKAVGKVPDVAGKVADAAGDVASSTRDVYYDHLAKAPETPAAQHGVPVRVESPLDSATVGKSLGGKDLSQAALETLQGHVGDQIPVGSTAKNMLMKSVAPVADTINQVASTMNAVVQQAPKFTTSVMQDSVFGEGTFRDDIESLKKNLPPSVAKKLGKDVDGVLRDSDAALNSNDPSEVLESRRQLGQKIDWTDIAKNPSTPAEVQNAARIKVYRALGDKIHSEIPSTVALDKTLQPNLELRSHMRAKLGDRAVDDPVGATAEHESELAKGIDTVQNALHNERVARNWGVVKNAIRLLGLGYGIDKIAEHWTP